MNAQQPHTMNQHRISPSYFTDSKLPYLQPVGDWTNVLTKGFFFFFPDAILLCCSFGDGEEVDCQHLGRNMLFLWYHRDVDFVSHYIQFLSMCCFVKYSFLYLPFVAENLVHLRV